MEPKKKDDLANQVCALLTKDGDAGLYTPTKPRRSPHMASPQSVGSIASGHPGSGSMAGSSGRKSAPKALLVSFGDGHAMDNMRARIATRTEKKQQVADEANKSLSSKGKASKDLKKATTEYRQRRQEAYEVNIPSFAGVAGETEGMDDAKDADCAAMRPLALKLARVYKPCALVAKKTELMEGVGDTHDLRPRRKEDIVDWLVRVLYKIGYYEHGLLAYAGFVALLEKHE